jgi:hypothetical protein
MSQKPPGHQALAGQPTDQNSRIWPTKIRIWGRLVARR